MPLFQPSTKAVSAAAQEIADCVGASGDAEQTARAGRSLFAALEHFNNRYKWNFLFTEYPPIQVFAPFSVTGVTASGGSASVSAAAGHGVKPDDFIAGSGFITGLRVSATASTTITLYGAVTGFTGTAVVSASFTRDMYDLPSDYKSEYTTRLLSTQRTLRPVGRRLYDRSIGSEQQSSSVWNYDLFMVGSVGKIRILPPPDAADVLLLRYHRRMNIPTTTATATVVDIPQDYEPYVIAWSKWHFLTDKGEGRTEQAKTWFAFAQEGLATMVRDQTARPDEDLRFIPGQFAGGFNLGDNTTTTVNWDWT